MASRARDYRSYLRAIDRRPIPKNIRTAKLPGHLEIVVDPKTGKERLHRWKPAIPFAGADQGTGEVG